MDFIAIDFETANYNGAPCSLGLTLVANDEIQDTLSFMMNPHEPFSQDCVQIHGITPDMVADAPEFPEIWAQIQSYFHEFPVVAHNARFDSHVLIEALHKYKLDVPKMNFYCTLLTARKSVPGLPRYGLKPLCTHFGIPLDNHHDGAADSLACAQLLLELQKQKGFKLMRYGAEQGPQKSPVSEILSYSVYGDSSDWYVFADEFERISALKAWKLLSPKAPEEKQFYYGGIHSDYLAPCEIIGYQSEHVLVLNVEGKTRKIDPEYLLQMQPTKEKIKQLESQQQALF